MSYSQEVADQLPPDVLGHYRTFTSGLDEIRSRSVDVARYALTFSNFGEIGLSPSETMTLTQSGSGVYPALDGLVLDDEATLRRISLLDRYRELAKDTHPGSRLLFQVMRASHEGMMDIPADDFPEAYVEYRLAWLSPSHVLREEYGQVNESVYRPNSNMKPPRGKKINILGALTNKPLIPRISDS